MSAKKILDFTPAQYFKGKECYVSYYVVNPLTGLRVRKRIKLNHIAKPAERERYAKKLVFEINDKLYNGWNPFLDDLSDNNKTLSAAIRQFVDVKTKEVRPDSIRSYRSMCNIFLEWLEGHGLDGKPVAVFGKDYASKFMCDMESRPNFGSRTFNNYLRFFSTLFLWFVRQGYAKSNPFDGIGRKRVDEKIRDVIPHADRNRIAQWFIDNDMREYLYVMQLCYRLLIRPKEILMIRVGFIDFKEGLITLPPSVTKNHKSRTLAVPAEIMSYLSTLKGLDPNLYVFSTNYRPGKRLMNTRDTGETWRVMRDSLCLPKSYQFYSLKDSGITELLESGVPSKYVQELADHHSLEMTERYVHKSSAKKILQYNKIEF